MGGTDEHASKKPDLSLVANWSKDSTINVETVTRWWTLRPNAPICIDLGRSNLTVLDFDKGPVPNVGLPPSLEVKTGRGTHYYAIGSTNQGDIYVDGAHVGEIKSAGGYVLGPTSTHWTGAVYTPNSNKIAAVESIAPIIERLRKTESKPNPLINAGVKVPYGQHDKTMHARAGRLRYAGAEEEAIFDTLVAHKDDYESPGPDFDDMARKHAHNICKHEVGKDSFVTSSKPDYSNIPGGADAEPATPREVKDMSVEDIHELVDQLIFTSPTFRPASLPKNAKKAANFASTLIYEHLKTRGNFYFADNQGYLLLKGVERVFQVSSEDPFFANLICDYGLLPGQAESTKLGEFLRMKAQVEGIKASVSYSSHYNTATKSFYFMESLGNLIRVTKDKIDRVRNGTDGELFIFPDVGDEEPFRIDLDHMPVVKHSLIPDEDSLLHKALFNGLVFDTSAVTAKGKTMLLTVYIMLLVLGGVVKNRPTLQLIGPTGCGKSTLLELIGGLIVGKTFALSGLPDSKGDFETALINSSLVFFDNVEGIPTLLKGMFCTASTGFNIKKRELFTDTCQINVPSKATLGLTALTEQLVTSEQTNRSMIFNMRRRKETGYLSDEVIRARFDKQRAALVSEIIVRGQMILQALDAEAGHEEMVGVRLAGIGTLILAVARHEGWEETGQALLRNWNADQLEDALKGDDLSTYLQEWMTRADWCERELTSAELSSALKPLTASSIDWKNETSWKGNARSLSVALHKSEESYAVRFGLTIRKDSRTRGSIFCFHPTASQLALLRPEGWLADKDKIEAPVQLDKGQGAGHGGDKPVNPAVPEVADWAKIETRETIQ
jgi:energy-coupling factor transporter ATP-binding protein EcfA2